MHVHNELPGLAIGLLSKTRDFSAIRLVRFRPEHHPGRLIDRDLRHFRLVDPRANPQLVERNQLENGAAGHHHVSRIALPLDNQAVERRGDLRIREPRLVVGERLVRGENLLLPLDDRGIRSGEPRVSHGGRFDRLVKLRFSDRALADQLLRALIVPLGLLRHGHGPGPF